MAIVGGSGSLYGPILGGVLVTLMRSLFATIWDRWLLLLGLVFVIFVMFFRGGIWEGVENVISFISKHLKRQSGPEKVEVSA